MTRPQPRRSQLAGQSIIGQQPQPVQPPTTPAAQASSPKQKITVSIDGALANEARGLYLAELASGGPRTWSAWVERAIRTQVEEVRQQYGKTAPLVTPGELPRGPQN